MPAAWGLCPQSEWLPPHPQPQTICLGVVGTEQEVSHSWVPSVPLRDLHLTIFNLL